ncbi:hypothetical protein ABAC460_01215 [Asticcacaulis sp. AC460]|nr:hypothetical protein ABAC460_01215 [Asticcacaulis sp. AC460]
MACQCVHLCAVGMLSHFGNYLGFNIVKAFRISRRIIRCAIAFRPLFQTQILNGLLAVNDDEGASRQCNSCVRRAEKTLQRI